MVQSLLLVLKDGSKLKTGKLLIHGDLGLLMNKLQGSSLTMIISSLLQFTVLATCLLNGREKKSQSLSQLLFMKKKSNDEYEH